MDLFVYLIYFFFSISEVYCRRILLVGTSSSGKSSIASVLQKANGYTVIKLDDYLERRNEIKFLLEVGLGDYNLQDRAMSKIREFMVKDGKKDKNVVFDDVGFDIGKTEDVETVLLYTSPYDLCRNLHKRTLDGDLRGLFVFDQFASFYHKTDKVCLEQINYGKFVDALKQIFYFFKDEGDLTTFARNIFKKLGLEEDGFNCIGLREEYVHIPSKILRTSGQDPFLLAALI